MSDDQPALSSHFDLFARKMQSAGVHELAVRIFEHYYRQLCAGATGYIDQYEAAPVESLPDYDDLGLRDERAGRAALSRTVVLKLNGGLGTSMGMSGPKSLLVVKDKLTFLDIILRQVIHLREETGARLPLVLMNSFNTHDETRSALADYPSFTQDLPIDFVQHEHPKIWKESLTPVEWPEAPEKEWCPPGHGDIYVSLVTTGMLDKMLDAGYEYLFVSNSDNLGAVLDLRILGYFAEAQLPFLMEVAHRTLADSKGGHLGRRPDGRLILRESSQCPPEEMAIFQDIERYRFFNTNNLWLHLPTLKQVLVQHGMISASSARHSGSGGGSREANVLDLPLIRNEKPVDPASPSSPRVYQLETAMGSAISQFEGAQALRVPRTRFIPVKKTNDLLLLWSDVYELTTDFHLRFASGSESAPPLIYLDERYYGLIDDLWRRFPHGAPSLLRCTELHVEGDVTFGRDVVVAGVVRIANERDDPLFIPDGARLQGAT
jgi:UTP--glucose-1-phosphate uridylyltransferase